MKCASGRAVREAMYPVVFFDALRIKIREDAVVRNKAVYLALGVRGRRQSGSSVDSGAPRTEFWLKVFNDLKVRGCTNDILIAVTDGEGMAELQA